MVTSLEPLTILPGGQWNSRTEKEQQVVMLRFRTEPGKAVDGLVAGDQCAVVVGQEAGAAGAAGQVVDTDEGVPKDRPVPGDRPVLVSCCSGEVRGALWAVVRLPGPVPRRHRRASPPYTRALVFDGRGGMISGTGRSAKAPPSAPPGHSERPHGRVKERGRLDTP